MVRRQSFRQRQFGELLGPVALPGEPPAWAGPGDVAVIKTTAPYLMASDPDIPPQVVVEPGRSEAQSKARPGDRSDARSKGGPEGPKAL